MTGEDLQDFFNERRVQGNLKREGVRPPKAEKREMRVLDREEQTRLILAARQAPEPAPIDACIREKRECEK